VLDLLEEYHRKTYFWADVGLESVNDDTLRRINRQSTRCEFVDAMRRTKARGIRVCAHVIFGLPGDSDSDMLASIDLISELNLDGVKIHNLYIDSESAYADLWKKGRVEMIARDRYIDLVCQSIERLRPGVLVHRLTGEAPRGRHLAPDWAADKGQLLADIHRSLARRKKS
jgi:radical SAM protein (TIGR01212 family)